MDELLKQIRHCTLCKDKLPMGPNPVIQAAHNAKLLIIGQAPGTKVHQSGIPWNDASGNTLREWLELAPDKFYDPNKVAIMPMGFCYPGKGKSGDLPPIPVCAKTWHTALLNELPNIELILLVGQYAQKYYLNPTPWGQLHKNLTERVKHVSDCPAPYFALPHPSPRNRYWRQQNPWFGQDVLPILRAKLAALNL